MSQPPNKRRRNKAPETLDWRELASGPALRGLSEVLGTPPDIARERASRRMSLDGLEASLPSIEAPTEAGTPTVVDVQEKFAPLSPSGEPPTVGETFLTVIRLDAVPQGAPTVGETATVASIFIPLEQSSLNDSPTVGLSHPVVTSTTEVTPPPLASYQHQRLGYRGSATVGVPPTLTWIDTAGVCYEPRRVQRVQIAQQTMTLGEERFYQNVWNAKESDGVTKESSSAKVFSLGYDRLAKLVRLDEKSVRMLIPKLVTKQILEILASENSASRIGRTYRIFSLEQILARQHAANQMFIVKKGRAVEFVTVQGVEAREVSPTVGVTTGSIARALSLFGAAAEDDVRTIIAGCRRTAPDATFREIIHFIEEKGNVALKGRIANRIEFLMVYVPKCFAGETLTHYRQQQHEKRLRDEAEAIAAAQWLEAERKNQELLLQDPNTSEQDKHWARKFLQD